MRKRDFVVEECGIRSDRVEDKNRCLESCRQLWLPRQSLQVQTSSAPSFAIRFVS